ncbi:MAG TPA: hypothetical protein DDW24_09320 [Blastocatellia bacterium]|nr:hypothetical protein [Blastocatellia bacterium]
MIMSENQKLAAKIARLLEADESTDRLAPIFASLEKINHRLDKLEGATAIPKIGSQITTSQHPSQNRFTIAEAIADEVFGRPQNEKACTFEPNARPCDHCAMCSSRGF